MAEAQATVERAKADLKNLKVEYDRYTKLHSEGAVTTQDFDRSRTAYEVAQAQLDEVQKRYELIKEGPRKEEIERARTRHWRRPGRRTNSSGRVRVRRPSTRPAPASTRCAKP